MALSVGLPGPQIVDSDTSEHGGRALLEYGQIHVNASESPAGQRFSIAHEIGHYLLHRDGFVFSALDNSRPTRAHRAAGSLANACSLGSSCATISMGI